MVKDITLPEILLYTRKGCRCHNETRENIRE